MKYLYAFYLLVCIAMLEFTTIFWIGTKDDFEALKSNLAIFMLNRFILNLIIILIQILFLWLVWAVIAPVRKSISAQKLLLTAFVLLNVFSLVLVLVNYFL
ncbi:hypothetical protein AM493_17285 [Flavobacterium akiainvivens]|uniref:Uncharacterized protein n=1 Tax=Flavobacterium akiainvivens TaxID=1202724 RepID=A0A0M8MCZ7_9FLAO|nr:hypothetical protein [Flavobacterium akiainvivens]KOS07595.1 hypothetical protein AM493_17285 [Flavobacterium akiainvivens]SFQ22418.1 hypothetical protein SAMN05444144_10237 [Flavobacterium akiainvivens]